MMKRLISIKTICALTLLFGLSVGTSIHAAEGGYKVLRVKKNRALIRLPKEHDLHRGDRLYDSKPTSHVRRPALTEGEGGRDNGLIAMFSYTDNKLKSDGDSSIKVSLMDVTAAWSINKKDFEWGPSFFLHPVEH